MITIPVHCLSDDGGGEYGIKVCGVRIYPEDFYTDSNVCVFVMPRFVKYAWISDSKVAPIVKSPEYIIVRSYEQG